MVIKDRKDFVVNSLLLGTRTAHRTEAGHYAATVMPVDLGARAWKGDEAMRIKIKRLEREREMKSREEKNTDKYRGLFR